MSRMTRAQAHATLLDGVRADLAAAGAILALLDQQFECAVRHQSAQLAALAGELEPQLEAMEKRRAERVALVRALAGSTGTMAELIASLPERERAGAAADWAELEERVRACKLATVRNSSLLAEQFSVMQRVLHGEEETYAPR